MRFCGFNHNVWSAVITASSDQLGTTGNFVHKWSPPGPGGRGVWSLVCAMAAVAVAPCQLDTDRLSGQRSFRGSRRRLPQLVFALELLSDPKIVMLLRPIEIDLAGTHGFERALHSDRADIDVG